jgi:hypothetical protein
VRPEIRRGLIIVAALALGITCAEPYARLAAPLYKVLAQLLAQGHPWQIDGVDVMSVESNPGAVLRLTGFVREHFDDVQPAVRVASNLHVGAVAESLVIFWTLLLIWPAPSARQRLAFLALGVPVFLCLEAATSVCQLLNGMAEASAVLGGDSNPLTMWERWSRFLEGGGRVALALSAAILTVTAIRSLAQGDRRGLLI